MCRKFLVPWTNGSSGNLQIASGAFVEIDKLNLTRAHNSNMVWSPGKNTRFYGIRRAYEHHRQRRDSIIAVQAREVSEKKWQINVRNLLFF